MTVALVNNTKHNMMIKDHFTIPIHEQWIPRWKHTSMMYVFASSFASRSWSKANMKYCSCRSAFGSLKRTFHISSKKTPHITIPWTRPKHLKQSLIPSQTVLDKGSRSLTINIRYPPKICYAACFLKEEMEILKIYRQIISLNFTTEFDSVPPNNQRSDLLTLVPFVSVVSREEFTILCFISINFPFGTFWMAADHGLIMQITVIRKKLTSKQFFLVSFKWNFPHWS